jgi:hypothetical protein
MIDFLLGVPGKLKTLTDRLTATWAAKLDTLHDSRLTATRAGYLDKLNLSGKATDDAVWTNARAGYLDKLNIDPTRDAPIATNFPTPLTSGAGANAPSMDTFDYRTVMGCVQATTTSATLVDAVNITGSGVLNFVVTGTNSGGGGYPQIQIIIDGVTIVDFTGASSPSSARVIVGGVVGSSTVPTCITFDQIPFKSSLVIRHRNTSSNTTTTYYKLRRTS